MCYHSGVAGWSRLPPRSSHKKLRSVLTGGVAALLHPAHQHNTTPGRQATLSSVVWSADNRGRLVCCVKSGRRWCLGAGRLWWVAPSVVPPASLSTVVFNPARESRLTWPAPHRGTAAVRCDTPGHIGGRAGPVRQWGLVWGPQLVLPGVGSRSVGQPTHIFSVY